MQEKKKKTVAVRYRRSDTDVPILVLSGDRQPDAYATFLPPRFGAHPGIRVLGPGDFDEMAFKSLSKKARQRLRELIALRQGLAEQEEPSYWRSQFAKEKPHEEKFRRNAEAALVRDVEKTGRPSSRTVSLLGLAELKGDPPSFLSCAITEKLSKARLVFWWKGQSRGATHPRKLALWWKAGGHSRLPKYRPRVELELRITHLMHWRNTEQFVPAIACPDLETGFYVYALFRMTGRGFGICLWCGEVFQELRPDQLYCCFSHGEAYRIDRWRKFQREKKAQEKKRRGER